MVLMILMISSSPQVGSSSRTGNSEATALLHIGGRAVASTAGLSCPGAPGTASAHGGGSETEDSLVHQAYALFDVDLVGLLDLGDPGVLLLPGALLAQSLGGDSDLGSLGREGHSVVDEVLNGLQQLADGLGEGRASGDGVVNIDDLVERLDGVVQGRDGELSLGGLVGCLGDHGCVLVVVRLEVG